MIARTSLLLLAAGGLCTQHAVAYACGSGGGSDSGSSSSSSDSGSSGSDYSSSSSSTVVAEPACVDATDVNGYRNCAHYGDWARSTRLPAISFELSTWTAQVDLHDVDVSGNISHSYGPDYTYRVVGEDLGGTAMAAGLKARIIGHHRGVYGGIEGGFAVVNADEVDAMPTQDAMLSPRVDSLFIVGAVAGVERGFGRMSVGGELFGGARVVGVRAESHRGACETIESNLVGRGVVEARVRADVWVNPWLTVGAYAGRDVMGAQTTAGVGIGGHLRAFDGAR